MINLLGSQQSGSSRAVGLEGLREFSKERASPGYPWAAGAAIVVAILIGREPY